MRRVPAAQRDSSPSCGDPGCAPDCGWRPPSRHDRLARQDHGSRGLSTQQADDRRNGGGVLSVGATGGMLEPGDSAGAKLQADSAIEDSALRVARILFLAAQQQYATVAAGDITAPRLANPKELARLAQGVDLLLDVSSTSSVVKRPFNSRYSVNTNVFGRLIDVPSPVRSSATHSARWSTAGIPTS